jgi:GTP-binding protein HflX
VHRGRPIFGSPMSTPEERDRPLAVVVGVQLAGVSNEEHASSLQEIERLATTLGLRPIGRVTQRRATLGRIGLLGKGKLRELAAWTGGDGEVPSFAPQKKRKIDQVEVEEELEDDGSDEDEVEEDEDVPAGTPTGKATVVLVDHDLHPSQARNLEKVTGVEVLDRTSIILSIFQRHARTREARLQVEIARLNYSAPRMREVGAGQDRQRGGIGGKGAGESSLELDRRKVRDRIAELKEELAHIERDAGTRREQRREARTCALVGYTNAGKSSWMRALTGGEVLVADKLFATLDTTVRKLHPATKPAILVSDTVGFIKKLPHDLVASFRSTLEEAESASLLVHVLDAADPAFRAQLEVTRTVLGEVGVTDTATLILLNKIDMVSEAERELLRTEFPDALQVSSRSEEDRQRVHAALVAHFDGSLEEAELFVPWAHSAVAHTIHEAGKVLSEVHEDEGTRFVVRAPKEDLARIRRTLSPQQ